jgi:hypothetical protein
LHTPTPDNSINSTDYPPSGPLSKTTQPHYNLWGTFIEQFAMR